MKVLILLVCVYVCAVSAYQRCYTSLGLTYDCAYACCDYYDALSYECCVRPPLASTYWYAWFLLTIIFLLCVCACIGCGGYRYRRRYMVRQVQHPQPAVVVTAHAPGYQQFGNQYKGYEAPPPYNPKY